MTLLTDAAPASAPAPDAAPAPDTKGGTVSTPNASAPSPTESARWAVPEDYRAQEAVRKFMDDKGTLDPSVLLKSHIELESKMGRDKIAVPKTPEEKREVWSKLGCPQQPEMYSYKPPEKLPDGVQHSTETEKFWRQAAHANGLTDEQFNGLAKVFIDGQAQQVSAYQAMTKQATDEAVRSLKIEWGADFDARVGHAKLALREYGGDELVKYLNDTGLGNDARLIRAFEKVGAELMGDAKLKGMVNANGNGPLSREEAAAKLTQFRADNHAVLFNSEHVDHRRVVAELERLHKMAAGAAA